MRLKPCTPVLARPDGGLQVGVARPVLLRGLDAAQQSLVRAAETAHVGARDLAVLGTAGRHLYDAGLLAEDAVAPTGVVAIQGAGRVGLELGAALAAAGLRVGFTDRRPAAEEPGLYPRRALVSTCAGGAAWAVRERQPDAHVVDPANPSLVVLVTLGGAARHATAQWEHDGVPHLVISLDDSGAIVGPLVVPGVTACGRCVALERTDHDPAWPALLDQLSVRAPKPAPGIVPDVVATAARMITAHLRRAAVSGESWRIDAGAAPRRFESSPHPRCGCGAAVQTPAMARASR
ncbi:hypothetical protein RN607_11180 [Demequina capsici]|uniref:Bacteriocin biosynthesis cyclodehydratase domain-containing protein n=1 Tax=Demequina capsici TaxID=3075620 RepID=A0AA96FBN2_9MICO|nr:MULTISPECIES: hypothetical protein [unclassified Demequina]WNM23914.1 hypothetical protein RN606_11180 [Demequina sp. OYTSA14]WNM26753.1 hypothetical protein RN607_11180 [Demequina sp. PMTSA13]